MSERYTVADAVGELVRREAERRWPRSRLFFVPARGYPPASIDAPYWYVLGAELWAWELSRREWLEDVRTRLGLVTIDGGMPRERREIKITPLPPWDPRPCVVTRQGHSPPSTAP